MRVNFWSNWLDLRPWVAYNWRTFKFVGLEVERDVCASDRVIWEIFVGLIGFNVSISWTGGRAR